MSISSPTALITGGAKRIGRAIATLLHEQGFNIMVHYKSSSEQANQLVNELNAARENSAACVSVDLLDTASIPKLIDATLEQFGQLNVLINNASTFYPTPIELINDEFWNDLIGSNFKAPAFLIKAAVPALRESGGCVVNIIDIHAQRPLSNHPVYCSAKAGLEMLTKSLAVDLAPQIRVNAVSPGAILWPEMGNSEISQSELLQQIPLQRMGDPIDIAKAANFLITEADYMTGQVLTVDGGRSVGI